MSHVWHPNIIDCKRGFHNHTLQQTTMESNTMLNCRPLPERRRTAVIFVGVLSCIRGSQSFLPVSPFRIQTRGSESALWSTKNGNTQPQRGASLTLKPLAPIKPKNGLEKKKKLSQDEADQSEIPAVKRGRGRPRKTTSTTPTVPKKVYNVVRSNHDYSRYEMLDHELLTADEEQILGNKVKRAIQLRKQIQGTVEIQRGKQEKNPRPGYLYESDDMEEEEDDDEEDGDDAALFSGSKANTYFGDNFQDDAMAELSVYGKGEKTLMEFDQDSLSSIATAAYSGGDYMDYELDNSNSEPLTFDDKQTSSQSILDDRLLTEEYIVHTLKVEGGRAELYHIFMEGALARDKMIRSNIRLVVSIAKKWALQSSRGLGNQNDHRLQSVYAGSWNRPSLDEAIQEGIIGLSTAADRFEPDRKLKFGTYATWWITSYVRKCFQTASTGCLRIPPNFHSIKHKYQQIVKRNYDYEGDIPPIKEIAEEMGLAVKRLQFVLDSTRTLLSIDAPLSKGSIPGQAGKSGSAEANGGESTLLKNSLACAEPQPEDQVEFSFLRQCLENAMAAELSPHERDVLRLRLGLDDGVQRSAREVVKYCGGTLNVSDVRAAEMRAFRKLRSPYAVHTYQLLGYLDFVGIDLETANTDRYASSNGDDLRNLRNQIDRTNQRRKSRIS